MITLVLTTSNRLSYLKKTMNDLTKFKDIIDKIIIFSFKDLNSENYIKRLYHHKFKKIITIKSRNNFELEHRIQYVSEYKPKLIEESKYVWFMSDKDRILVKNSNSIKMILRKNINGLTMNMHSLNKTLVKEKNKYKFDLFSLQKGIHRIGLISSQILSKRLFLKYSKKTKLSAYYLSEIILKIIINEKKWFFCSEKVIGYTHINWDKNRDKLNLKYLTYRVDQEFKFYVNNLNNTLSLSKYPNKKNIIKKAFFKNVISWLILFKKKENNSIFSNQIQNYIKTIKGHELIKISLFTLIYIPNYLISFFIRCKKLFY